MKQQHMWFACDYCDEESEPETSTKVARESAKRDGWLLGKWDVCPACIDHHKVVMEAS